MTPEAPPPLRPREHVVISVSGDMRLQPRLQALWRFWDELRATRTAPRTSEVHALVLRPWLGNILLLDVLAGGHDFRYRLYGSIVAEHFGFDLTGRLVSACTDLIGPQPLEEYRRVVESAAPEAVVRVSPAARDYLQMDKLALPLVAVDGGPVSRILVGLYASEAEGRC